MEHKKIKIKYREAIEKLTDKEFPNLCKLSLPELSDIEQIAKEAAAFWRQDGTLDETGPIGCGAVCKHGHNELTCRECND